MLNVSIGSYKLGFIVNGLSRHQLGTNFAGNVLGPGDRDNSTISLAIRLIQINAMGLVPGAETVKLVDRLPALYGA